MTADWLRRGTQREARKAAAVHLHISSSLHLAKCPKDGVSAVYLLTLLLHQALAQDASSTPGLHCHIAYFKDGQTSPLRPLLVVSRRTLSSAWQSAQVDSTVAPTAENLPTSTGRDTSRGS